MQDSNKPDLDESLNVTSSHERTLREAAAVVREKHVDEGGKEPMSLWIFGACAIVLLVGGLALGNAGSLFNYNETVRPDYVRKSLGSEEGGALQPVAALKAYASKGGKIYTKCASCHGSDGKGGGTYPSLSGSEWVLGDTQRLAMIILNGLSGPTSTGKDYNSVMVSQAAGMSPADLAAVMTYVRNSFGNSTGDVITAEMAAEAMKLSEARANPGTPVTATELESDHLKNLPGEPLDPAAMVDPVSLAPAEAGAE